MPPFPRALCAGLALAVPATAAPARAAQEDTQLWTAVQANVDLGGPVVLMADWQHRYTDKAARVGQDVVRASLGWKLDGATTLAQGYAYARTDPLTGPTTFEHRPFQQLTLRIAGKAKGPALTGRTRLEERFMEGSAGMALRLRQQLRGTVPLGRGLTAIATAEAMVHLNSASWGAKAGLDQTRLFAGIGTGVAKGVTLEGGYLNQYVVRHGRADRMNHIFSLSLSLRR